MGGGVRWEKIHMHVRTAWTGDLDGDLPRCWDDYKYLFPNGELKEIVSHLSDICAKSLAHNSSSIPISPCTHPCILPSHLGEKKTPPTTSRCYVVPIT